METSHKNTNCERNNTINSIYRSIGTEEIQTIQTIINSSSIHRALFSSHLRKLMMNFQPYDHIELHNTSKIKEIATKHYNKGYGIVWHSKTNSPSCEVWEPNNNNYNDIELITKKKAISSFKKFVHKSYTNGYRFIVTKDVSR